MMISLILGICSFCLTQKATAFSPSPTHNERLRLPPLFVVSEPPPERPVSPFSEAGAPAELLDLFNHQVTNEFSASQLYLSASIWFNAREWEGMAAYMLAEADDERTHALSFVDFANKRNIPLHLEAIPAPQAEWDSVEQVWEAILEMEHENTISLLHLAEQANQCQDYAVLAFLNPFHMEQVDSEDKINTILAKVHDEKRTPGLLRQLDHDLGLEASSA